MSFCFLFACGDLAGVAAVSILATSDMGATFFAVFTIAIVEVAIFVDG